MKGNECEEWMYMGGLRLMRLFGVYRTLLTGSSGLEHAKGLVSAYKQGKIAHMTPELWTAKKVIDSTLHPGALLLLLRPPGHGESQRNVGW